MDPKDSKKTPGLEDFAAISLLVMLAISIKYEGFNVDNQNDYSPPMFRQMDTSYLKNDWFVNANSESFNVRYYFHAFNILINRIVGNMELTYLMLQIASGILVFWTIFRISMLFFENKRQSYLAVILLITSASFSLGGTNATNYTLSLLSPSGVAAVFSLAGMYFLLKDRYLASFVSIGIATIFHVLNGVHAFGVAIIYIMFSGRMGGLKRKFEILKSSTAYFLVASLNLVPLFISQTAAKSGAPSEFIVYILAHFRVPWHYSPFSWGIVYWLSFLCFLALFFLSFRISDCPPKLKSFIKCLLLAVGMYAVLGTLFVEIVPVKALTNLALFRVTYLLQIFGSIFISKYFCDLFANHGTCAQKIFISILLFSFLFRDLIFAATAILFMQFILKVKSRKDVFSYITEKKLLLLVSVAAAIAAAVIFKFNAAISSLIESHYYGFMDIALNGLILLFLIFVFWTSIMKNHIKPALIIVTAIIIAVVLSYPLIGRAGHSIMEKHDDAQTELFSFLKGGTEKDAILLTPPYIETFRLGAERAIVVDFKALPLQEKDMVEWYIRILDVTNNALENKAYSDKGTAMRAGYGSLADADISALKEKYNFSYAVFEKPKALNYPMVYENKRFAVYKITKA